MLESKHRHRPDAAADALHAEPLAFQIFGGADLRRGDKVAVSFVDDAGEEGDVETAGRGADDGARNREGHLNIAGGERRHGLRAAADVDDFDIYAVLAKNSLLDAQSHDGDFFTEGAVGDAHQRQLGGAGESRQSERKQE